MKHIFSLFTLLMIAMAIQAQEHLSFMDVPIDGPLDKRSDPYRKGASFTGEISPHALLARVSVLF